MLVQSQIIGIPNHQNSGRILDDLSNHPRNKFATIKGLLHRNFKLSYTQFQNTNLNKTINIIPKNKYPERS